VLVLAVSASTIFCGVMRALKSRFGSSMPLCRYLSSAIMEAMQASFIDSEGSNAKTGYRRATVAQRVQ